MDFEWDPRKDAANYREHGVDFREATTIFGDPFALTFPDVEHSEFEQRFLTIGAAIRSRVLVVVAQEQRLHAREELMKKKSKHRNNGDVRPEYDFASMKGGIRGKYYEQYRRGTNVVLLEPDVAKAFPTEDAVNQALRGILSTTSVVQRTAGQADRALRPARSPKRRSHI
jgi:uncharacterized DUF497 family protein